MFKKFYPKEYMESIIRLNRFNANNAGIISDVAKYIQNSAEYDFNYDKKLDSSTNIAISLLKEYKSGVYRHYAMAATMLYRALSIPARYTEGVIVNAEKNTEVSVNAMMRHAWVEVYVEGIGWQMVEVTGGYGEEPAVPDKEIAPEDLYMYYENGTVILANRYTTANAVHQLSKLPPREYDGFLQWLFDLEYGKMGLPKPDLVLYLCVPPEVSRSLIRSRSQSTGRATDIHEKDSRHLDDSYRAALYSADKLGWAKIDCARDGELRTREDIHQEILTCVKNTLGL